MGREWRVARKQKSLAPRAWVVGRGVFILGSGTLLFSSSLSPSTVHGACSSGAHGERLDTIIEFLRVRLGD